MGAQAMAAVQSLLTAEGRIDPYPLYDRIRQDGPLVDLGGGWLVATGHAECDRILRDSRMLVQDASYLDSAAPG